MPDATPTLADLQRELNGWRVGLLLSSKNAPKPLLANALIALREAPEWRDVLAYDEFALVTMQLKPPPWLSDEDNWTPKQWTDRDDALTADWLQHQGIGVTVNVAATAAETVAKDHSFHPIKEHLESLVWDGVERIANFAAHYLGAEPTPYHRAVSRCLFVASVARIMRPGCKADYVPILEGAQDKGKSTAIELLFTPWFSDDLAELGTKDAAMQVRVAWGIEIAELASMTRGEIERVKAFITRKVDRFRPSYGRRVIEVPRQSVFIGSTNSEAYLKDETGGRRFWPIRCGNIDLKAIERDRSQLWAEAVTQFNARTPWWITDTEMVGLVRDEQAARKGARTERGIVNALKVSGIAAVRVPLSGAAGGRFAGDIVLPLMGRDLCVEVKARADGFRELYSWLDQRDVLIVKADRQEPLVIVRLSLADEIAKRVA